MNVKIGIQPTCWTNDDFPEVGDDTPYQLILDETAAANYEGGSTGHNYPKHLPSLIKALNERSLTITSTWAGTSFTAPGRYDQTLEFVRSQIAFLKKIGSDTLVVAELEEAVNQVRHKAVLTDRPVFNEPQWYLLTQGLNEAGRIATEEGMKLCYHPHVGTGVQTRDEVDRLLDRTDPNLVSMCLDTGHALFSGHDPIELTMDHISRIKHVHLKNVRKPVLELAVSNNWSFYQSILTGIFTVPGDFDGCIDFIPILDILKESNYQGWIVVEAEQDPSQVTTPFQFATMARKFIRKNLGV